MGPEYPILSKARNHRPVHFTRVRFASTRGVGDLHLADPGKTGFGVPDDITFADLRMVKVKGDPKLRTVDSRGQRQHVGGRIERAPRVFAQAKKLKGEKNAYFFRQVTDAMQRIARTKPHPW